MQTQKEKSKIASKSPGIGALELPLPKVFRQKPTEEVEEEIRQFEDLVSQMRTNCPVAALEQTEFTKGLHQEIWDKIFKFFPEDFTIDDNLYPQAFLRAFKYAQSRVPVLILGGSGTGKEFFARYIHDRSNLSGRFHAKNAAAFSGDLIDSELFGHIKGAFTGANKDRMGAIETANDGTLFIDEVSHLTRDAQTKLLRFLQEKKYLRVGEDE